MFFRRFLNAGRQFAATSQLIQPTRPNSLLQALECRPAVQPVCSFFDEKQKIEFLKAPIVDRNACKEIVGNVNNLVQQQEEGRLFAVVHLCGRQFKVTSGDILVIEGYWPPTIGDELKLEKVLLVGGDNFTMVGRPMLDTNVVDVKATIVEKTIAHARTHFRKKRRKRYMRIQFHRSAQTMIRINTIDIKHKVSV